MKKNFAFIGFLLFTLVLYATPMDVSQDVSGVSIEQPQDFVTVDNIDVTVVKSNFIVESPKLEGWTDDYSLNVNRYEYLFQKADLTFTDKYNKGVNYFYREIEKQNRPPDLEANFNFLTEIYTTNTDCGFKAIDKNILFGFWIC